MLLNWFMKGFIQGSSCLLTGLFILNRQQKIMSTKTKKMILLNLDEMSESCLTFRCGGYGEHTLFEALFL